MTTFNVANYNEPGGAKQVISSGGEVEFRSGSTLDIQSGTTLTNAAVNTFSGNNTFSGTSGFTGNATFGVDDTGVDVTFYGATAGVNSLWDQSADEWVHTNLKHSFKYGAGAAASASGLLMGGGTSANPLLSAVADDKFIEFRAKSTATSGDNRLQYLRYDLGGAAGGGECIRALTDLTAAVGTARGAHISLQPDDTGYVSGLGAGVDSQLLFGDAALGSGGTYAALNAEVYSAGASTDVSGCTKLSFFRAVNGGNATGAATVDTKAFIMELSGFTGAAGVTKAISTTSLAELPASTIGLAIDVGGTRYYIPAVVSTEWN